MTKRESSGLGWTGGQYSIYRALLAFGIALLLGSRIGLVPVPGVFSTLLAAGCLACGALAAGWRDRNVAVGLLLLLLSVVALMDGAPLVLPGADVALGAVLLVLHIAVPPKPFGAWDAAGRVDPAGDWQMPRWIPRCAWILLTLLYLASDLQRVTGSIFQLSASDPQSMARLGLLFDLAFGLAFFIRGRRAAAWVALSLWKLAWVVAFGSSFGSLPSALSSALSSESGLWLLHVLTFDPAWIPSRRAVPKSAVALVPPLLFYDGNCGFCHRTVRIILAEDAVVPEETRLRFAPIDSEAFRQTVSNSPTLDVETLPDSILLRLEDGSILDRTPALLEIADRLGGAWRLLGFVVRLGGWMPISVLDRAYDTFARYRTRFFAKPKDSCPILPPRLRTRFES